MDNEHKGSGNWIQCSWSMIFEFVPRNRLTFEQVSGVNRAPV